MSCWKRITVNSTNDLKVNDKIVIEGLSWIARKYLGVSNPAVLNVFGFDRRPGVSKVGVKPDGGGSEHWFDDGSYQDLLNQLRSQASFTDLYVMREDSTPPAAAAPMVAGQRPPRGTGSEMENEGRGVMFKVGLNPNNFDGYTVGPNTQAKSLNPGDYVYTRYGGGQNETMRLWKIMPGEQARIIWSNLPKDPGSVFDSDQLMIPPKHAILVPIKTVTADALKSSDTTSASDGEVCYAPPTPNVNAPWWAIGFLAASVGGAIWWYNKNQDGLGEDDE